jgi:hypothetical protein
MGSIWEPDTKTDRLAVGRKLTSTLTTYWLLARINRLTVYVPASIR